MGQSNVKNLGNGGTMDGDVTITGDLTVSGGIGLTLSEVIEGTSTIDVTNTEAFLVRKNSDGGDVFIVDSTNTRVGIGCTPAQPLHIKSATPSILLEDTTNGYLSYIGDAQDFLTGDSPGADSFGIRSEGDIRLGTGGNNLRMTINSSGNVGIGTSSPTTVATKGVEIVNTTASSATEGGELRLTSNDGAAQGSGHRLGGISFAGYEDSGSTKITGASIEAFAEQAWSGSQNSSYLSFKTNEDDNSFQERMRIDSSGNVGIGCTPETYHSSVYALQLKNGGLLTENSVGASKSITLAYNQYVDSGNAWTYINADEASYYQQYNGDHYFATAPAGSADGDVTNTVNFKIDANSRISLSNNDSGTSNTIFGKNAGDSDGAGDQNVFVGELAGGTGTQTDAADGNVGVGYNSLTQLTTGSQNTSVGSYNSDDITEGSYNTSVGRSSLASLTVGSHNTVMGRATFGVSVHDESYNVAIGNSALGSAKQDGTASSTNREVKKNVAIGYEALVGGTLTGTNHLEGCVAIGANAMVATGANNQIGTIAIGQSALGALTSGERNTALGYQSLMSGTGFADNTAVGFEAGKYLGDDGASNHSSFNTIFGRSAMGGGHTSTPAGNTAHLNTAIGHGVLGGGTGSTTNLTATNNTAIGYASMNVATSATSNVTIGHGSGQSITTATRNVAVGYGTLDALTANADTANGNIAVGYNSLGTLQTGSANIAIGTDALYSANLAISSCTVIGTRAGDAINSADADGTVLAGYFAGGALTSGQRSTAVGYYALANCDDGDNNTAIGWEALEANCGDNNTALGTMALKVCTGGNNTAIGQGAMTDLVEGTDNVAIGKAAFGGALDATADASVGNVFMGKDAGGGAWVTAVSNYNIGIGYQSMDAAMNGALNNVGIGYRSLGALTQGDNNVALGSDALFAVTTGSSNVAIGEAALDALTAGGSNVAIGRNAGGAMGVAENANILIGFAAGGSLDEGTNGSIDDNIAIGLDALVGGDLNTASTAVNRNIAIGTNAMNSTGTNAQTGTIAIGYDSLTALTSGNSNTAVGYQAADSVTTGSNNTVLGYEALIDNVVGSANTAIGRRALYEFVADADNHGWNTAVGQGAGYDVTTGTSNTIIGNDAANTGTNDLTTGDANTLLGGETAVSTGSAFNQSVIGYGATGQANNSVTLGNASVTAVYMAQDSGATVHCAGVNVTTGINFPDDASANPSADANTLDNYEEGTYTPTITGASSGNFVTGTYTTASYVKIGSLCHVKGYIQVDSDNSASGVLRFSLPFAAVNGLTENSEFSCSPFIIRGHGGTHTTGLIAVVEANNAYFNVASVDESGSNTWLTEAGVDGAWNFYLGITYQTA